MRHVRGVEDGALHARVVARVPLLYAGGADPALDRPAHVRAASSIRWAGNRLAVIQDDARFVALVDPSGFTVECLALPAAPGGVRLFDDERGNKAAKLDLEAALTVRAGNEELLLAFGSGSTPAREQVAVVNVRAGRSSVREAHGLYAALRERAGFAGSELNVEGAISLGGRVRLFNRGNGAPRAGLQPVNATAEVAWDALWKHLQDPASAPVPRIENVVQYDLGALDGLRFGFTDACAVDDRVLYSAAAEDSPDATRDGAVAGSALGVIGESGDARYAIVHEGNGEVLRAKVEGVTVDRSGKNRLYVVVDVDEPGAASELCVVEIAGDWGA